MVRDESICDGRRVLKGLENEKEQRDEGRAFGQLFEFEHSRQNLLFTAT